MTKWNKVLIVRSAARCGMAFGQLGKSLLHLLGIKRYSSSTKSELANRKRQFEHSLRDSGLSRSEAKRIAGASMRKKNRTHERNTK